MNRIVNRYKQFQIVFILYSVESLVLSDLHTNNSKSCKKVARELPQKRRKRPTLLKKSNHASRAARTSQRSQPNNVLDNTRKSKTRVENPNFWVYSNPIRTQETVPKLVSDSTFVPKTPKPRTWRNPTLSFWYPNLIRIFLYPTRSLYRQRSRC